MKRIESLDHLRGLMAISVMVYHYLSWSIYEPTMSADSILGKLGIYAVSIFYILSGLSLTLVYNDRIKTINEVYMFLVKRIFRILPLFWLATTLVLILKYGVSLVGGDPFIFPFYTAILNYTLLFGFFDYDNYIAIGAWSIGNEVVFYFLLPWLFILTQRSSFFYWLCFIFSLLVACYFSFFILNDHLALAGQWSEYINPLNQFYLFLGGVAIGKYGRRLLINRFGCYFLLMVSVFVFCFYSVGEEQINIVVGFNRLIYSLACFSVVLAVFLLDFSFKGLFSRFLSFSGDCCYSIYLLHPVIALPFVYVMSYLGFDEIVSYVLCIPLTLFFSGISYKYIEKKSIHLGKIFVESHFDRKVALS